MHRPLPRRAVIAGALGLPCSRVLAAAPASPVFEHAPTLLVAGPDAGPLDDWARRIADAVNMSLPAPLATRLLHMGGLDGVTAANQFDARVTPDGATALLITGAPALAWLSGDPRAQFDAGRWFAVLAGFSPAAVFLRPKAIAPLRLPADGPYGAVLAARLGLALLGRPSVAVADVDDPMRAMATGQIDAVLLRGVDALARARAADAAALFSLGIPEGLDGPWRGADGDAGAPIGIERAGADQANLLRGWRAVALAAQLEFALVLPGLTPANVVAWWRVVLAPLAAALADEHRLLIGSQPRYGGLLSGLALDAPASLALRQWILDNDKK